MSLWWAKDMNIYVNGIERMRESLRMRHWQICIQEQQTMFGMIDFVGNLAMVTTADTKYWSTASDRRLRSAQLSSASLALFAQCRRGKMRGPQVLRLIEQASRHQSWYIPWPSYYHRVMRWALQFHQYSFMYFLLRAVLLHISFIYVGSLCCKTILPYLYSITMQNLNLPFWEPPLGAHRIYPFQISMGHAHASVASWWDSDFRRKGFD